MNLKKITLFVMILIVGLTVVSAADIVEDDDVTTTVEPAQTEQTTNDVSTNVETLQKEKTIKTQPNPVTISNNVTITTTNINNYNFKNWTVCTGVTVNADDGVSLTDVAINVAGNNVTLDGLTITTTDASNYIVNAADITNLTVKNSALTISNTGAYDDTFGIYLKDVTNALIENSTITVNAPSRGMNWGSYTEGEGDDAYTVYYSMPSVGAIVVDSSDNINITANTIDIDKSGNYTSYSTMPAIIFRNMTNNSYITENVISASGAQYVYGIMVADGANNLLIKNNTVASTGELYVAGIDASTANNTKVCKNIITAHSHYISVYKGDGDESLAYGIISDERTTQGVNNTICSNLIDVEGNVIYGIEVYRGCENIVCSNNITGYGSIAMGIALAHTNSSLIVNNIINITGNNTGYSYFYEEVTPVNTGIILTNQSNNNLIQGNNITLTAINDSSVARAINITNDTLNNVTGNYVRVNYDENGAWSSEDYEFVIQADEGNDVADDNDGVILYSCNCCCDCGLQNTVETEEEGDNFLLLNLLKI